MASHSLTRWYIMNRGEIKILIFFKERLITKATTTIWLNDFEVIVMQREHIKRYLGACFDATY